MADAKRKLTMEQAREIRAASTVSDMALGRAFGVSPMVVRLVRTGVTYKEEGMVTRASPMAGRARKDRR